VIVPIMTFGNKQVTLQLGYLDELQVMTVGNFKLSTQYERSSEGAKETGGNLTSVDMRSSTRECEINSLLSERRHLLK